MWTEYLISMAVRFLGVHVNNEVILLNTASSLLLLAICRVTASPSGSVAFTVNSTVSFTVAFTSVGAYITGGLFPKTNHQIVIGCMNTITFRYEPTIVHLVISRLSCRKKKNGLNMENIKKIHCMQS